MKGAFLVSEEPRLATLVLTTMQGIGARVSSDGVAQVADDQGRLFTVFTDPGQLIDEEWRGGDPKLAEEGPMPNMDALSACWIECRFENLFVAQVQALALALPAESWVLDGDDVLWPAVTVDPARVRL